MRIVSTLFIFLLVFRTVMADDAEKSFTQDLGPGAAKQALPAWMTGQPEASGASHATVSFPITPPPGDSDLAVTFYFAETPGGFLRAYWVGARSSAMLSDNLFEGIGMQNQRTVLIKREMLTTAGSLNVQSSEAALNVSRIHWEWVEPVTVSLSNGVKQTAFVTAAGEALGEMEVDGGPPLAKPDKIGDSVVSATLTTKPERIEAGVEFVATLQQAPQYARVEAQFAGVPIGKSVKLWLNGVNAGEVSLAVPGLDDPGYQQASQDTTAAPQYVGWRKAGILFPAALLKIGDNRFQFTIQDANASAPVAVKDLIVQLKYGDKPADTPATTTAALPPSPSPTPTPAPAATPAPSATQTSPASAKPSAVVTQLPPEQTPPPPDQTPPAPGQIPLMPELATPLPGQMPLAPEETPAPPLVQTPMMPLLVPSSPAVAQPSPTPIPQRPPDPGQVPLPELTGSSGG